MYQKITKIANSTGLHARPASQFVALAKKFKSSIRARKPNAESDVDAKSIIMVLTSGFYSGDEILLEADGEDEVEAVNELVKLIESFND